MTNVTEGRLSAQAVLDGALDMTRAASLSGIRRAHVFVGQLEEGIAHCTNYLSNNLLARGERQAYEGVLTSLRRYADETKDAFPLIARPSGGSSAHFRESLGGVPQAVGTYRRS